jgi:hypothetical protein
MLNIHWYKCKSGNWCSLETVNLDTVTESGIYIIWHAGNPGRVVYIGQGNPISNRLASHRNDARINKFKASGNLHVTWAEVPVSLRDGVERHLADQWRPLVGDAHPDVSAIAVNSPWAA